MCLKFLRQPFDFEFHANFSSGSEVINYDMDRRTGMTPRVGLGVGQQGSCHGRQNIWRAQTSLE
jgi:hypothetical protein